MSRAQAAGRQRLAVGAENEIQNGVLVGGDDFHGDRRPRRWLRICRVTLPITSGEPLATASSEPSRLNASAVTSPWSVRQLADHVAGSRVDKQHSAVAGGRQHFLPSGRYANAATGAATRLSRFDIWQGDHRRTAVVPGPRIDPGSEDGDLLGLATCCLLRRHGRFHLALDLADDAAVVGLAGDEDGAVQAAFHQRGEGLQVEAALEFLASGGIPTTVREERADLLGIAGRRR